MSVLRAEYTRVECDYVPLTVMDILRRELIPFISYWLFIGWGEGNGFMLAGKVACKRVLLLSSVGRSVRYSSGDGRVAAMQLVFF